MGKYQQDVKDLLKYIGGKENISAVSHCVTRMRFVLADPSKADIEKIENIPAAKGTFTQSGQFQVIIGNDVSTFYNEFVALAGVEGVSKAEVKNAAKSNQTVIQRLVGALGEIFAPIIPALVVGGLILGFRNVIDSIYMFNNGTQTLVQISQFWAGVDSFLWLPGEAIFAFLPVGITWSITKKMGTTQILGIILGITLVSPQLLNAYAMATTPAADIPVWNFGYFTIQMVGYQAQVIPAMLAGFALAYLEKFFRKVTPEVISMIVVPFLSLLLAIIFAHTILGPVGWIIGSALSNVVYAGLTSGLGWLFSAVFGFFYAPLVITGLHHMTNAIDMQLVAEFNGTILWPMIALSNIAQGSSVLAMSVLQKKNERAQQINIPACISCYLGVTEPALFGVNLKYMFPFICGMTGSALAAMFSVGTGVMANSIGVGGLPGILSIQTQFMGKFAIAMLIAIAVPFALTYYFGKKRLTSKDLTGFNNITTKNNIPDEFVSPMSGKLITLDDVQDQAFASRAMGDGFAIELNEATVVSPVNGKIVMTFPTKHAYGIETDSGQTILIHIGMDTVELKGEPFKMLVAENDYVSQGDPICEVDIAQIKKANKSLVSPVIFTSKEKIEVLKANTMVKCNQGQIIKIK